VARRLWPPGLLLAAARVRVALDAWRAGGRRSFSRYHVHRPCSEATPSPRCSLPVLYSEGVERLVEGGRTLHALLHHFSAFSTATALCRKAEEGSLDVLQLCFAGELSGVHSSLTNACVSSPCLSAWLHVACLSTASWHTVPVLSHCGRDRTHSGGRITSGFCDVSLHGLTSGNSPSSGFIRDRRALRMVGALW